MFPLTGYILPPPALTNWKNQLDVPSVSGDPVPLLPELIKADQPEGAGTLDLPVPVAPGTSQCCSGSVCKVTLVVLRVKPVPDMHAPGTALSPWALKNHFSGRIL